MSAPRRLAPLFLCLALLPATPGHAEPSRFARAKAWVARKVGLRGDLPLSRLGLKLQKRLVSGARRALRAPTFAKRNAIHARAVARETTTLALLSRTIRPTAPERGQVMARKLGKQVIRVAGRALRTRSFQARNRLHADVVSGETASLALRSVDLHSKQARRQVYRVFRRSCFEAGAAFAPAFDASGNKLEQNEQAYKAAMSKAGAVAYSALPDLLHAIQGGRGRPSAQRRAGLERVASGIIGRATFEDVAAIISRDLGISVKMDAKEMLSWINKVVPQDDYLRDQIANLEPRRPDAPSMGHNERRLVSLGIRLANATWKAGQVHRAAWEGNDSRINPTKRGGVYNPFDVLKAHMFNETYHAYDPFDASRAALYRSTFRSQLKTLRGIHGRRKAVRLARKAALSRVVWEVYKDLYEIQRFGK